MCVRSAAVLFVLHARGESRPRGALTLISDDEEGMLGEKAEEERVHSTP